MCWCGGSYACISMFEQGGAMGSILLLCNVLFVHIYIIYFMNSC